MKCQDTLFEGNSRVVRGVFLTLVGMLLKVVFLKILNHIRARKKAKWNKKIFKKFWKENLFQPIHIQYMYHIIEIFMYFLLECNKMKN